MLFDHSSESNMSRRKVRFQTSVNESEQSEAMRMFLLFESGNSGHLTLNQFKQAVYEMENQDHVKLKFCKYESP